MPLVKRKLPSSSGFQIVKSVEIRYLRSLYRATLRDAGDLNLLFGRNDSGKSNLLRALNLFFNGHVDPTSVVQFDLDFSDLRRSEAEGGKVKKYISIRVDFNVPKSFGNSLGTEISVKRQWNIQGDMNETVAKNLKTGARIQLTKFLNQIDYTYIPAIKDISVFGNLIERMYDAAASRRGFQASADKFIGSIRSETESLSTRLSSALGTGAKLAAPTEMGKLFRTMDFALGSEEHSLFRQKGDGIKARHLPELLRYINDNEISKKFFIWGFEEPENSLDLGNAIVESVNFANIASRQDTQIFISSHSPAFYMSEPTKGVGCRVERFFVNKQMRKANETQVTPPEAIQRIESIDQAEEVMLDASLLQLPFLIRKLEAHQKEIKALEAAIEGVRAEFDRGKPTVFVEGESDRIIFERAFQVFSSSSRNLTIKTKLSGAGDSYVLDMLSAWRSMHKHHPDRPKAVGILDIDFHSSGADKASEWNSRPGAVKSAKCFKLPVPEFFRPYLGEGYRIPIVLEVLYGAETWRWAERKGYLEAVPLSDRMPKSLIDKIVSGELALKECVSDELVIFLRNKFRSDKKIPAAKGIANYSDSKFVEKLHDLRAPVEQMIKYLEL